MENSNYRNIDWVFWDLQGGNERWRNEFLECVQKNILFQLFRETTSARDSDAPSILDLIFSYSILEIIKKKDKKIICIAPQRKIGRNLLMLEYVVDEEQMRTETPKRETKRGKYVQMNNFFGNTDWDANFSSLSIDQCH